MAPRAGVQLEELHDWEASSEEAGWVARRRQRGGGLGGEEEAGQAAAYTEEIGAGNAMVY